MRTVIIAAAIAAVAITSSCNFVKVGDKTIAEYNNSISVDKNSPVITKDFDVEHFDDIKISASCAVEYVQGPQSVSITCPEQIMEHLIVSVDNGSLNIKLDRHFFNYKHKSFTIRVASRELEGVEINGAAKFNAGDGIRAKNFNATVNGAAEIRIEGLRASEATIISNGASDTIIHDIDCEELSTTINGAGSCVLTGKANLANITLNGAGDINIKGLRAGRINSNIRGIGNISGDRK